MPSINSNPFADPEMLSISDIEDKLKTVASSCEGAIQLIKTKRGRVSFSLATQTRHDNEVRSTIIKSLKEVKRMSEAAVSQYDECWYKVQNSLSEARAAVASIPATDDSIAKSHQFLMDKARETEHLSFARTWAANYNPKSESAPSTLLQDADKWYAQLPPKDKTPYAITEDENARLKGRRQTLLNSISSQKPGEGFSSAPETEG